MRVPVRVRTSERRGHQYSEGALPVRRDRHAVGLNLYHNTTFHNVSFHFFKQLGTGKHCVICLDKTRLVEFPPRVGTRTGKSDVYQQPIAGLSPESSWVKEDVPGRGDTVFVLVSHSHHKTSRLCVETKRCWTLAEDFISEWEQRKISRAGGGASCKSRKTCVIFGVHVVRDPTHDQASLQLHEFRNKLTAAGALAMFNFMSCLFTSLTRSLVLQFVLRTGTALFLQRL